MPEAAVRINGLDVGLGTSFDLGTLTCTEEDIIAFAQYVDPLPLHIDREAAAKGLFGGIVASGAQLYIEFHKRWFVPTLGPSVLCGLGINNWHFMVPHLPDVTYSGKISVIEFAPRPEKGTCRIHWLYEFFDPTGLKVQEIEVRVLHRV